MVLTTLSILEFYINNFLKPLVLTLIIQTAVFLISYSLVKIDIKKKRKVKPCLKIRRLHRENRL